MVLPSVPIWQSARVRRPRSVAVKKYKEETGFCRIVRVILGLIDAGEIALRWRGQVIREDQQILGAVAFRIIEAYIHGAEREPCRIVPRFAFRIPWTSIVPAFLFLDHLLDNFFFHDHCFRRRANCAICTITISRSALQQFRPRITGNRNDGVVMFEKFRAVKTREGDKDNDETEEQNQLKPAHNSFHFEEQIVMLVLPVLQLTVAKTNLSHNFQMPSMSVFATSSQLRRP